MLRSHFIWICLASLIIIQACESSDNRSGKESGEAAGSADSSAIMHDDSILQVPPPPGPGLAPGRAKILGELKNISESTDGKENAVITIVVRRVIGYGPSTPPLANNVSVRVVATELRNEINNLKSGKIITAIISYQQTVLGGDESPDWSLVAVE